MSAELNVSFNLVVNYVGKSEWIAINLHAVRHGGVSGLGIGPQSQPHFIDVGKRFAQGVPQQNDVRPSFQHVPTIRVC